MCPQSLFRRYPCGHTHHNDHDQLRLTIMPLLMVHIHFFGAKLNHSYHHACNIDPCIIFHYPARVGAFHENDHFSHHLDGSSWELIRSLHHSFVFLLETNGREGIVKKRSAHGWQEVLICVGWKTGWAKKVYIFACLFRWRMGHSNHFKWQVVVVLQSVSTSWYIFSGEELVVTGISMQDFWCSQNNFYFWEKKKIA